MKILLLIIAAALSWPSLAAWCPPNEVVEEHVKKGDDSSSVVSWDNRALTFFDATGEYAKDDSCKASESHAHPRLDAYKKFSGICRYKWTCDGKEVVHFFLGKRKPDRIGKRRRPSSF